jgi:hypothetical protein
MIHSGIPWGLCCGSGLLLGLVCCPLGLFAADDPPADLPVPRAEVVQPAAQSGREAFQRALQALQEAKSKLAKGQTGDETQALQRQVLADLDALLNAPPQKSTSDSPQGGGGQQQNSQNPSSTNAQEQRDPRSRQQQSQSQQQQQRQPGSEQERGQAEDSEERTSQHRAGIAVPLSRRRMEVDVWGHLPEKVREQLLNSYGERIVPQYEELVRRYYESLAGSRRE